mgnify:CR=1 FL=1|jgi:hypothetical protein|nr:MAG TPA: Peroxin 14 Translocation, PPI inhibition, Protein-Inhibitor [Caudoviricetes sp.]
MKTVVFQLNNNIYCLNVYLTNKYGFTLQLLEELGINQFRVVQDLSSGTREKKIELKNVLDALLQEEGLTEDEIDALWDELDVPERNFIILRGVSVCDN